MRVAIIPARGGSKRIPGKNIKLFAGKPIIAYSISIALSSNLFDRVIVSTDSEEIAEVAHAYGAEIPFIRPSELSDDFTTTADVIQHALDWFARNSSSVVHHACCIYATAPFVQIRYLREGLDILKNSGVVSAFTVAAHPSPIYRALHKKADGSLSMVWPEYEFSRSNDLPPTFFDAGQFYWLDVSRFMVEKKLYGLDSRPIVLPRYLAQDIDTMEDWRMAEAMFQALRTLGILDSQIF